MAWAAVALFRGDPIFWPATMALWSFAISYLTKGRALLTIRTFLSQSDRATIRTKKALRFIVGLDGSTRPQITQTMNRPQVRFGP